MSYHAFAGLGLILTLVCSGVAYFSYCVGRAIERDAHTVPGMQP